MSRIPVVRRRRGRSSRRRSIGAAQGGSSATSPAVIVVQTAVGDYRQQFLDSLQVRMGDRIRVLCGTEYFERSTRTRVRSAIVRSDVRNTFLAGRRLLWQAGATRQAATADVAVLEFNPRILNSWVVLVLRRMRGRPTLLWGHAWSRSGPDSRTEPLRNAMRRLSSAVLVYTDRELVDLRQRRPRLQVFVAPNAIDSRERMGSSPCACPTRVIWIGRLVPAKKPETALYALSEAIDRIPVDAKLTVVGDGELRPGLEVLRNRLGLQERVEFVGHVNDPDRLALLFREALVSIATGYVGLNLIQSLGFGVPMIFIAGEPHAPEIAAATEHNSVAVLGSDPGTLGDALVGVFDQQDLWRSRRHAIADECKRRHSTESMADGFVAAITGVWHAHRG